MVWTCSIFFYIRCTYVYQLQGIAPNEQEEALLGMLNENQLDLLDVSKDVLVDDPDPPTLGPSKSCDTLCSDS